MKRFFWWLVAVVLVTALGVRIFQLTQSPPAPYWEEVALGYDAYSLLKTGRDHHGNFWPVIAFESFGDWKPSGYFYALLPFIQLFGLNVFSVRLLSVVAGLGIVAGFGALAWQFTSQDNNQDRRRWLVLLALFISALSPWLIQFSRAAWEANLATFFITWGVVFGWQAVTIQRWQKSRFIWLLLSVVSLFAAMYTYHSARILAPALGIFIGWLFIRQDLQEKMKHVWWAGYILPLLLVMFLVWPFISAIGTPALGQRLAETSIFSDIEVIEESNRLKLLHDDSLLARLIYHRYVLFGGRVANQFLSHFNPGFLFITGDANPRHATQYFGLSYPFEIIFLITGVIWAVNKLSAQQKQLLTIWLIFGILPAALTRTTPHALRILLTAPVFLLLITLGGRQAIEWLQKTITKLLPWFKQYAFLWLAGLITLYLLFFTAFFRHLLLVYPQRYATEWQYGYQEMIKIVERLRTENPDLPVYITREQGRPAMYYWFYTQTDPGLVQQANEASNKDQGEYLTFGNISFVRKVNEVGQLPAIVASSPEEFVPFGAQTEQFGVMSLDGRPLWSIGIVR